MSYTVIEDNEKAECPEKVLALWLGARWREKVDKMEALPSGNVLSLYRTAKKIQVYRID